MLACLFLLLSTAVGFFSIHRFFPKLIWYEQLAMGWLIGLVTSSWLALIVIRELDYTDGIFAVAAVLLLLLWRLYKKIHITKISSSLIVFLLPWAILFIVLFVHTMMRVKIDGLYTLAYSYGDLALHSSIINHFVQQDIFSLQHPLVATEVLRYPFLLNFHSALLIRLGFSLQIALVVTGILTLLSTLTLLYQFCLQLSKNKLVPWIASGLYFFNGGAGWLLLFKDSANVSNLIGSLRQLPVDFTYLETELLLWSNVITTHILPQRGFMIGLAVVMMVLRLLQQAWQSKKISLSQLACISTLIGLLPLFHSYTYLFLAPLFLWLGYWAYKYKKISLMYLAVSSIPLLIGVLQLWYISAGNVQSNLHLQLGWKASGHFVSFWLKNMGFDLAVLLLGSALFLKASKKRTFEQLLVLPSISVYLLCNIFVFQPNDWDNMKFMLLAFLIPCLLTAAVVTEFFTSSFKNSVMSLMILLSMLSGILSVAYVLQQEWLLLPSSDVEIAQEISALTPADSLFLTSDSHNHLVPMLTGRPIVLGYKGWLWTHGIDYQELDTKVRDIYLGKHTARQLLTELKIQYVFIGNKEQEVFAINESFFENNFTKILYKNGVVVYKIE